MRTLFFFAALFLFTACAPKNGEDPLKNTKKLIVKGHSSLYENGMLEIPFTKVHFIPAVSSSTELSQELFFEDARMALQQSLKDALASVYIIPEGTKKAYEVSKDVYRISDDLSSDIRDQTRSGGTWLLDRSSALAKEHIWGAFDHSKSIAISVYNAGNKVEAFFDIASKDILDSHWKRSQKLFKSSMHTASKINKISVRLAKEHFNFATDAFVDGYITLPKKLQNNVSKMGESLSLERFASASHNANDFRDKGSLYFSDIISDTFSNYTDDVSKSFSKVGRDFSKNIKKEGVILSSLKSMRWLLQGILYDGFIKPIAKLTTSTVGLISVNGIIYPIHLVVDETKTTALVMVEVTAQTAKSIYDIVAPSMSFALASVLSSSEYLGGKVLSGTTVGLGATVSGVDAVSGLALSGASQTTGLLVGETTKYIGVPLAVSTQAVAKVGYGVLASTSSAVLGTGVLATGETASLAIQGTGAILSGGTLVGGTGLSVATAGVEGLYQLSKAAVLPVGYTVSSATVLGYGSLSQLQAHTLLAASDAAYMVLSLEGPKWVLYSISGNSINDDKVLPAGAILDLKMMQENNETIKRIQVSDKEIENVLSSLDEDLPEFEMSETEE